MTAELSPNDGHDRRCVRVLIVDDNRDVATTLSKLLQRRHFAVEIVTDAKQALEVFRQFSPDIALLDIAMPEVNGYELARRIRGQPDFEALPIIAISGYGDREHLALSAEAGIDEHLLKPVSMATLEEAIGREIGKKRNEHADRHDGHESSRREPL